MTAGIMVVSCTSQVLGLMWRLCKEQLRGLGYAAQPKLYRFAVAGFEDSMSSDRHTIWVGQGLGTGGPDVSFCRHGAGLEHGESKPRDDGQDTSRMSRSSVWSAPDLRRLYFNEQIFCLFANKASETEILDFFFDIGRCCCWSMMPANFCSFVSLSAGTADKLTVPMPSSLPPDFPFLSLCHSRCPTAPPPPQVSVEYLEEPHKFHGDDRACELFGLFFRRAITSQ